jgi:hypothetical protein
MANVFAVKNGSWSDTTVWNTLALPVIIDDVFSNNFTVYIDSSFQVRTVTNLSAVGIAPGGRFIFNDGVSLSANVIGGGTNQIACVQFLSAFPASSTLVGNLCAVNTSIAGPRALLHNSSGTMTVFGNGLGRIKGIGNPADGYIQHDGSGILNLFGNYIAGTNAVVDNRGIWLGSSGTINLVGNLSGGVGGEGLYISSTGTVNMTGNVFAGVGGVGASVNGITMVGSTGFANILGNVIGLNSAAAVATGSNTASTITIRGNVLANNGFGVSNNARSTLTVYGNVTGGNGANNRYGVSNTGTFYLSGDCFSGVSNNDIYGILNASTGNLFMTGDCYGQRQGSSGGRPYGLMHNSTGQVIIYGNAYGGTTNSSSGIGVGQANPSLTVAGIPSAVIYGSVYGGSGLNSSGVSVGGGFDTAIDRKSSVIIFGDAIAGTGSGALGATNNATGYLEINGTVIGNAFGLGSVGINSAPGVFGSQTGTTIVRSLCCGARGQWPTAGVIRIQPQSTSTFIFETSAFQDVVLFTSLSTNIVPPVSSVRLGTRYNLNDYTGTCAVPSISSVLQGVAVDDSIGIAALQPQTVWSVQTSAVDTNLLGGRLKESATVQSFGQLLTAFNI